MEKNIKEIKKQFDQCGPGGLRHFIKRYQDDERKGVIRLVKKADKRIKSYMEELSRIERMLAYENKYPKSYFIGGIDEAGRGPLAGPVVAAVVVLDRTDPILYVDDSKKLSPTKREELYQEITKRALAYGVGVVTEKVIDEINILQATYEAMRRALERCKIIPDQLLNDAVIIPDVSIPQENIIKGDAKSLSIAAASIVAKVSRDRIMDAYHDLYPEYDFIHNKGYGSAKHLEALRTYGPCPIHRKAFIRKIVH